MTLTAIACVGALGIMHLYGFGTKKDVDLAFTCLRHAAEKGNVYAMGLLISFYYQRKLFTKTAELAQRQVAITYLFNEWLR
jgi:TPR repeat protein